MTLFRRKAAATGALLFAHALVVLSMDLYMGAAIGGMGLVVWGSWESNHDPAQAALITLAAGVQGAVLVASVLASGFEMFAGVRGLQGDVRLARPAALAAVGVPALFLPVSVVGLSCVGAVFWTLPLVVGLVILGLAIEVTNEAGPPTKDWTRR